MKNIDFIIIGGQKTGSTYIHQILSAHPEIYSPLEEVPFLESPDYENGGLLKLSNLFEGQDENKLWGIKRPNYLYDKTVAKRINTHFESIKLIISLRNPYERFISGYFHNIYYGFFGAIPFKRGVKKIINGTLPIKYKRGYEILKFSLYSEAIKEYLSLFSNKNILILNFDDLKYGNKRTYIQNIYKYLNVDSSFLPSNMDSKPQQVNYSLPRLKFLRLKNRFSYVYNKQRTRGSMKKQNAFDKSMVKFIDRFDQKILQRIFKEQKREFKFPDEIIRKFNKDIEALEQILNRDFSEWKR